MNQDFVTDDTQTSELERAINELLELDPSGEEETKPMPREDAGDELQGLFGAQS
ncbi:MAG: hypothetical protein ACO1OB_05470 [Archangium sp.]